MALPMVSRAISVACDGHDPAPPKSALAEISAGLSGELIDHDAVGRRPLGHVDGADQAGVEHQDDVRVFDGRVDLDRLVADAGERHDRRAGALRTVLGEGLEVLAARRRRARPPSWRRSRHPAHPARATATRSVCCPKCITPRREDPRHGIPVPPRRGGPPRRPAGSWTRTRQLPQRGLQSRREYPRSKLGIAGQAVPATDGAKMVPQGSRSGSAFLTDRPAQTPRGRGLANETGRPTRAPRRTRSPSAGPRAVRQRSAAARP